MLPLRANQTVATSEQLAIELQRLVKQFKV